MDPDARDLAKSYGADETLDSADAAQAISELTEGHGMDAVIEIVGHPQTLKWSLPALKSGGKLILVGYAPEHPFALNTMAMHYNEYEIIGCRFVTKAELLELTDWLKPARSNRWSPKPFLLIRSIRRWKH